MTVDLLLRSLLLDGTPDPLSALDVGVYGVIDSSGRICVHAALPDSAWSLSAQCSWPAGRRVVGNVWAAIAPDHDGGVVVINLARVDISRLPESVQCCLRLQNARHGLRVSAPGRCSPQAVMREGVLTFTGLDRFVRIGAPYTATEAAYQEQAESAFEFLSPALQAVARVISVYGPLSRAEVASRVYEGPSDNDRSALEMTLSRLRRHPRVRLERGDDGLLSIEAVAAAAGDLVAS